MDGGFEILNDLVVINDPSAAYTCTSQFIEYQNSRGNGVELFVIDNSAYSLVKLEHYVDQEFSLLYNNGFFNLKIRSARFLGSQVLSSGMPNSKLIEMSKEIFRKTNVSVIVLPALRMANFKYSVKDFNKNGMSYFLLGGWQECINILVPENVEIYLKKLGKKKRYNLNRQSKKIGELIGSELKVHEFYSEEHVPEFIRHIGILDPNFIENNSWIKDGYVELAKRGLFHGFVFGSIDEPVAVVDAKKTNATLYVTKIFINSRFKELSPGSTAMFEIIKSIIMQGAFCKIDFGYGEPGQKNSSVSSIDYRGRMVIVNKRVLAFYLFSVFDKIISAKLFIKSKILRR